jgi:acetyl esterase/lipase
VRRAGGGRRRFARVLASTWLAALLFCGCGSGKPQPQRLITETVGRGPQTATIIRPDVDRRLPVVVFLHGWGATRPQSYRPWLDHLAREGNAVIYPRYQDSVVEPPPQVLGNVLVGVRQALTRVDVDPRSLVVAGHSAGGALAGDYAAIARSVKLPVPVAVFSAYPGRRLQGVPFGLPEVDPGRIPAATRLVALAGTDDRVVGAQPARRLARLAGAKRRSLVVVSNPAASDHLGPQRADATARREFWARLDRLIREARAG